MFCVISSQLIRNNSYLEYVPVLVKRKTNKTQCWKFSISLAFHPFYPFFFVSIIHLFYAHIQWDLKSVQHFWDGNYEKKYFIDLIY